MIVVQFRDCSCHCVHTIPHTLAHPPLCRNANRILDIQKFAFPDSYSNNITETQSPIVHFDFFNVEAAFLCRPTHLPCGRLRLIALKTGSSPNAVGTSPRLTENWKDRGHNISIHLTLLELAIGRERSWFGVIGLRGEIGIVAQVISVVMAREEARSQMISRRLNRRQICAQ